MVINVISSLLSLLFLFVLFVIFYKGYAIDKFREELFSIRDRLFRVAFQKKGLSFDSPVYRDYEDLLNNTIRYAQNISFIGLIIFNLQNKIRYPNIKFKSSIILSIEKNLKGIDNKEVKEELINIKHEIDEQVLLLLLKTSVLFMVYFIIKVVLIYLYTIFQHNVFREAIMKSLSGPMNEIEYQAEMASI